MPPQAPSAASGGGSVSSSSRFPSEIHTAIALPSSTPQITIGDMRKALAVAAHGSDEHDEIMYRAQAKTG